MGAKGWSRGLVGAAMAAVLLGATVQAGAVELPNVERRGNVVVGFTKERAIEHCYKKGKRLPTVRELAQWAQKKGALGIQESPNKAAAYPLEVDLMQRQGYEAVYLHHTDIQTVVDFYFNPKGFKKAPRNALGKTRIWAAEQRHVNGGNAYTFTPGWPTFREDDSRREYALVCI